MSYTIGELSRRSGVNIETIRYYERRGLLPQAPRGKNGRRFFGSEDLDTLLFIRRCREMLFSTEAIRALLPLRSKGPCSEVKVIASKHLTELRARLQTLAMLEKKLTAAVGHCPGDNSPDCSIIGLLRSPEKFLGKA